MIRYYDSPISTITYFIQSQLIQKVRKQRVKVLLGGTGADEQFTGYYDHFLQHYQDLKNNKKKMNSKMIGKTQYFLLLEIKIYKKLIFMMKKEINIKIFSHQIFIISLI